MGKPQWLRTDEREDVLVSLSACLICVIESDHDRGLWKWAILALHNALQGAMVCHLSGPAQLGALSVKSFRAWLDWYRRSFKGDEPAPGRLADAKELFNRLSSKSKRIEPRAGGIVEITASEQASFLQLHRLRNELSHFTPQGWSIEINGMPKMFLDVLAIIEKIASDAWPFRHMEPVDVAKRDDLIGKLRTELTAKKAQYEQG